MGFIVFFLVCFSIVSIPLYVLVYDLGLYKRNLFRQLTDKGFTDIKLSRAVYEDLDENFQDDTVYFKDFIRTQFFRVRFHTVRYTDPEGKRWRAALRVESRYFTDLDVMIKKIDCLS
ncbi:hypothetical protein SAMN04488109_5523 [Chryseolinea serpens]|uniref:Uncharacterized protein n=1 Tax=Chryseolinea serpens TaxID=947013 RepID=A0A1M5VYQ5_9BACT|nr:hypothetical protein SAMN04488109_5523 [Chryseolinea serpens]